MEQTLSPKTHNIHKTLAHSYVVYFIFLIVGVVFDLVFDIKVFNTTLVLYLGILAILLSTLLILWAQITTRTLDKKELSHDTFRTGPYRFTRSPTHWGLFLLLLGFGLVTNAFFVIMFTLFSLVITKFVFLEKEEKILEEKYGEHYRTYKHSVKL